MEVPIFHRDIKPENILIGESEVKLADFGCSNLIDEDRMTYCGTPDYIAPEMILGKTQTEKVNFGFGFI
jgi:serine/threonine protein kinase